MKKEDIYTVDLNTNQITCNGNPFQSIEEAKEHFKNNQNPINFTMKFQRLITFGWNLNALHEYYLNQK